jgi:hypothetical protein
MEIEKIKKLNIGCMAILSGEDFMEAQGYDIKYLRQAMRNVRIACNKRNLTVEKFSEYIDNLTVDPQE